jgi:hypothetical protein
MVAPISTKPAWLVCRHPVVVPLAEAIEDGAARTSYPPRATLVNTCLQSKPFPRNRLPIVVRDVSTRDWMSHLFQVRSSDYKGN